MIRLASQLQTLASEDRFSTLLSCKKRVKKISHRSLRNNSCTDFLDTVTVFHGTLTLKSVGKYYYYPHYYAVLFILIIIYIKCTNRISFIQLIINISQR